MFFLKLITQRHAPPPATLLTVVGLLIAVTTYGLLQTVIDAWYAGAQAASSTRLVTHNAISFVFPLPLSTKRASARSRA